jgi:predicted dehydrogenase
MSGIRIGLLGLGKITVDQHIPSIVADGDYTLAGGVSPNSRVPEIPCFPDMESLFAAAEVDAIAVNTPPQVRYRLARQALLAGKHVVLEKPPGATVAEVLELARVADRKGVTLYTGWHSQHAPGVEPARAWLAGKQVRNVTLTWCENVRQWHPGQTWIWQPGGLGVFDPGINALSILTRILPDRLIFDRARLEVPGNCHTPVAADLGGHVGEGGRFTGCLDFLQTGLQTWSIDIDTDGGALSLDMGGAELTIDGQAQDVGPSREYPSIYRRFAELIASGESEVDSEPLTLTSDAFLIGEQVRVEDFIE